MRMSRRKLSSQSSGSRQTLRPDEGHEEGKHVASASAEPRRTQTLAVATPKMSPQTDV